ncbi:MAG: tyrosine-type recombinase/integrase [Bacteroidia bacterium]|nr:tyrosine-type recombinase/integrase [Bacteroidia bacterium]
MASILKKYYNIMPHYDNTAIIRDFTESLTIKRYTFKTVKTYKNALIQFLQAFPYKSPEEVTVKEIETFINQKVTQENISASYQKTLVGAIKFLYHEVLRKNYKFDYLYTDSREQKLPNVLSKEEIQKILDACSNIKHKAILATIYGCGLRLSEVLNLKIADIDSKRMLLKINQSKGNEDRYVPLPQNLLELLREYYKICLPKVYLFEGEKGGMYAARSVQNILKKCLLKTDIKKSVSVHTLRHTYATHLLEQGTDIRIIQMLLGHKNLKTTQIYTHISSPVIEQVSSPLESIQF